MLNSILLRRTRSSGYIAALLAIMLMVSVSATSNNDAAESSSSSSIDKINQYKLPPTEIVARIIIKYRANTGVILQDGKLSSRNNLENSSAKTLATINREIHIITTLAANNNYYLSRLFKDQTEQQINNLRTRGEHKTDKMLADLNLYHVLHLAPKTVFSQVEDILYALNNLSIIEIAYAEPRYFPAKQQTPPDLNHDHSKPKQIK